MELLESALQPLANLPTAVVTLQSIGRNEVALKDICKELSDKHPRQKITGYKLDLSDLNAIPKTVQKIIDDHKENWATC